MRIEEILQDTRKVWSKYDEVHINKTTLYIEAAVETHGPRAIPLIRDEVVERFKKEGIVFCVDSYLTLFDRIWDRVGQEFELTEPEPEPAPTRITNFDAKSPFTR